MSKHRNVLTRLERLTRLESESRWAEGSNAITGLPKVRSIKVAVKKKKKKGEDEAGEKAAS